MKRSIIMGRLRGMPISDDFKLEQNTLDWLARKHPTIDPDMFLDDFLCWAPQYEFRDWQAAAKNAVNRGVKNGEAKAWIKKVSTAPVDTWKANIDRRAKVVGFRERKLNESDGNYEFELSQHERNCVSNVTKLKSAMK